jgi:hypothetical protein
MQDCGFGFGLQEVDIVCEQPNSSPTITPEPDNNEGDTSEQVIF